MPWGADGQPSAASRWTIAVLSWCQCGTFSPAQSTGGPVWGGQRAARKGSRRREHLLLPSCRPPLPLPPPSACAAGSVRWRGRPALEPGSGSQPPPPLCARRRGDRGAPPPLPAPGEPLRNCAGMPRSCSAAEEHGCGQCTTCARGLLCVCVCLCASLCVHGHRNGGFERLITHARHIYACLPESDPAAGGIRKKLLSLPAAHLGTRHALQLFFIMLA